MNNCPICGARLTMGDTDDVCVRCEVRLRADDHLRAPKAPRPQNLKFKTLKSIRDKISRANKGYR